MNERIHILIAREHGTTFKIHLPGKKLRLFSMLGTILLVALFITSLFSVSLFTRNRNISRELADLRNEAVKNERLLAQMQRKADAERSRLNLQITGLKLRQANQLATFEEEKGSQLSAAVNELTVRSELIEQMMRKIGVKVSDNQLTKPAANSGGPFVELNPGLQSELLNKADIYLETIRSIPLGKPVKGVITSRYGPRRDPLNEKAGFHEGIDFRGKIGDKVYATAAGVVSKAFRNGSYGNFVEIDHKNGYKTRFAHLKSYKVAAGDKVTRGQLIGLVGNTGRSTGPHLHYEMTYRGKPINPIKYMQVTKLFEQAAKEIKEH